MGCRIRGATIRMWMLLIVGLCSLSGVLPKGSQADSTATIFVTANPSTIMPGKASLIRVRLLDEEGRPYSSKSGFVLNVTITTLGNLALAKRTWVLEEIREQEELRRLSQPQSPPSAPLAKWPPPGAKLVTIASDSDLRLWQLPQFVYAKLATELQTTPETQGGVPREELFFGRTTEFFLARLPAGLTEWRFNFVPAFASGTFFIFAEISGKIAGSTLVKVQRVSSLGRRSVAWATSPSRMPRSLRFEYIGRLPSDAPPVAKYKYNFQLTANRPLDQDCQVDMSLEGPMTFLKGPRKSIKILAGETQSVQFLVMSMGEAGFLEQQQIRISATPVVGCEMNLTTFSFGVPPRFIKEVTFPQEVERVPGNGQVPLEFRAEAKDDLGDTPTPGEYGYDAATLRISIAPHGGPGSIQATPRDTVQINGDEPVLAVWKIFGTGDLSAATDVTAQPHGGASRSFAYNGELKFYFPYTSMFLLPLLSVPIPFIARRGATKAFLAYVVSVVLLVGGFFKSINETDVTKDLLLNVTKTPVWFWPAAVATCLAIGILFALSFSPGHRS